MDFNSIDLRTRSLLPYPDSGVVERPGRQFAGRGGYSADRWFERGPVRVGKEKRHERNGGFVRGPREGFIEDVNVNIISAGK